MKNNRPNFKKLALDAQTPERVLEVFQMAFDDLGTQVARTGQAGLGLMKGYDKLVRQTARSILDSSRLDGDEMTNAFGIGQVNMTLLGESLVQTLDLPERILDESDHYFWTIVLEVSEQYEKDHGVFDGSKVWGG